MDRGPLAPAMIGVVGITFLLSMLDGFDVISMSVAATALSNDWGILRAQLGPIFSAALIGMAVGAALLAPLADKIGRRKILLIATLIIGSAMICTAQIKGGLSPVNIMGQSVSGSILLLILVRFIAGLGVGIIFANAATIASEAVPEQYRDFAVLIAIIGYPFGAMIVGPIANAIIANSGWQMVFVLGGLATLTMIPLILLFLPESVDFLSNKESAGKKELVQINQILKRFRREPITELPSKPSGSDLRGGTVKSLLAPKYRLGTILLWLTYFMGFLTLYFLLTWIPTLFEDAGYSRKQGVQALTFNNLGAVFGILMIGWWARKAQLARPIAIFFFGGAITLFLIWVLKIQNGTLLYLLIFANGFLLQGAFTALYAAGARYYPTVIRATGIGWGAGLGRVGAILSPVLAGVLVAQGWGMYPLFLLFTLPLVIASLAIWRLGV